MRNSEVGYTWLRLIDNDDWPLRTLLCGKLQKDRQARQKESKKRSHGSPSERSYTFGVPPSIPFPSLFFSFSLSLLRVSCFGGSPPHHGLPGPEDEVQVTLGERATMPRSGFAQQQQQHHRRANKVGLLGKGE